MLYFEPGALITKARAEAIAGEWTNLDAKFLGAGTHFVQEDHGPEIGAAIVAWHAATFPDTNAVEEGEDPFPPAEN